MPYEKLVRDIKDILVSHAPEIFNTNMTTYNEAERVSKIAEKYANDYRDMAMRQDVLMRLLADFYNECQALDQEAQEKPQKHEDYSPLPKCSKCCWEVDPNWAGACAHCGSRKPQQPEECGMKVLSDDIRFRDAICQNPKPCQDHEQPEKIAKITSRHPLEEKAIPTGWSHSRKIQDKHLLLAMHENLIKIGKLLEDRLTHKD